MSIVRPPYLLDFAKSTLDAPPDFDPQAWEDRRQQRQEEFGPRWPMAAGIFDQLRRRWGIYHLDLRPRNIDFGEPAT